MRLDKYLSMLWVIPRRKTKKILKSWVIKINGQSIESPQYKIKEGDTLEILDESFKVKFNVSLLLHKPAWYISSNIDEWWYPSYKDLLHDCPYSELVEIWGRLDVDTEWLLFCSSDGKKIHNIIHPHKKVEKEYYVETKEAITHQMIKELEEWVTLNDGKKALPAKVDKKSEKSLQLIITEGKFHQVKRMLKWVNNEVIYLRRDRIWDRTLSDLEKGKRKYIE